MLTLPIICPSALSAIATVSLAATPATGQAGRPDRDRETVLDRRVHIETDVIRDIPQLAPLCDSAETVKRRARIPGCRLYCELQGKGPPIVLVHGGPGATHHGFHPVFSRAGAFASVIYYDQRGCGRSDYNPGDGYTLDQAVEDLENLRKALGMKAWIVLGHSYGGLLAQCYAVRYPDHLRGLVLVGSSLAMPVPLEPTRQYDFMAKQEQARIREINNTPGLTMAQIVYNTHLNGDWKRQNYYKPTPEELARLALYEWKHDEGFNSMMSQHIHKVDLRGAFEGCPVPTIIIEGKWDLTWNTDKPGKLHKNHPQAKLVMFGHSGHSPFQDEPDKFFALLRDFTEDIPEVAPSALSSWNDHLAGWRKKREASLAHVVRSVGWGRRSSEKIAKAYSKDRLGELDDPLLLLKAGFALYDSERYEEALDVFKKLHDTTSGDKMAMAVSLVWQGHVLDLLGRRDGAITAYNNAVDLKVTGTMQHDQYGLTYVPSQYARERIKEPFIRIENHQE